jgi:hypothetical protein
VSALVPLYNAEDCVCTHVADIHEEDYNLELAWCTSPGCGCKVYWPQSREEEFLRRQAFIRALQQAHPEDPILAAFAS